MMMSRFRPSPAMLVALVALFVSLGGVGYAATKIGTADIKDGAVTDTKLHKRSVVTNKIKTQAVTEAKIAPGAVTSGKLGDLAVGPGKLANESVGTSKLADTSVTASKLAATIDAVQNATIPANSTQEMKATCSPGRQAIAGGFVTPDTGVVQVIRMRRTSNRSWTLTFRNKTGSPQAVDARVTCLLN
jgi:hypothetical protein